ncbi:MAG: EamA family transporter [Bacteroidota bacterium]
MIYLFLAVTASSLILISFKVFKKLGVDSYTAITMNYLTGAFFGYNSLGWRVDYNSIISANWFPMSVLTGLILISGFVLLSLSTRKAGLALTAISSRMAVIISVSAGILFFNDKAGFMKMAGIIVAMLAFYMIFKKGEHEKRGFYTFLLPFTVFLFMGMNDIVLKITQYYFTGSENETEQVRYASTSFLFAFLLGIPILFARDRKRRVINPVSLISGVLLGLLNWYSTYFFLMGLAVTEVSVFVPLVNISVVGISSFTGYFLFREKLGLLNWIGVFTALLAIYLIAG